MDLNDTATVITLEGEYDLYRKPELEQALEPASTASTAIIDLSAVSFLDSTSIGCLVKLKKTMRLNCTDAAVYLIGARGIVLRVLELCGLSAWFLGASPQ